jgi:transposase-like protein
MHAFDGPQQPSLLQRMFAAIKTADHHGWTNWETWHTKLILDNDQHLAEMQDRMAQEGWNPEQIRDWTTKHIIGPENKRKLEDAREWNEIPEAERTDPHYEEVANKGPQHKDIMEAWFGGPDVSDTTPNLIDPELVNWDEIHHNIHAERDEGMKYEEEDQRLKGEGLTHAMPGHMDETNKMLDAWMKHHGVPDEGGSPYDNPIHVPIEHLEQGYGQYRYPEDYGEPHAAEIAQQGYWKEPIRDLGWHTLNRIQKGLETPYAETMHQALVGQGYPPEQVQHIMRPQYEQAMGEVPNGPIGSKPGLTWRKIEQEQPKGPDPRLDQPGKDVFPTEWTSAVVNPIGLQCPQCGNEIMADPISEDAFCTHCNKQWMIHRDEPRNENQSEKMMKYVYQMEGPQPNQQALLHPSTQYPGLILPERGTGFGPVHQGAKISGEMEDILGIGEPEPPKNNLNWTPGMKGRGIVIGGEPHTWNTYDPNQFDTDGLQHPLGPQSHPDYVQSLGIDPKHVDWHTGIEIDPDGSIIATGGHKTAPFIEADPRLKHVEGQLFPFGNTMPTTSRTNNMEPYESLWTREADVKFDQGPLQNTEPWPVADNQRHYPWEDIQNQSPPYSVVVQPSDMGLHGAHTNRNSILSFLDAHVNGTPVRGHGGPIITKYGFRSSPDFGKPMVVAVHDPAHLPIAVEAVQHRNGESTGIHDLATKIQSGEIAPPPGIDPHTLQPLPGAIPEQPGPRTTPGIDQATSHIASFWSTLGEAALPVAGLALAPETGGASLALDAGEAGALLGGEAAGAGLAEGAGAAVADGSSTAGGLMSKAMSGAGGVAKAEGVSSLVNQGVGMAGNALGGGQAQQGGSGGGYSGPLQQFTHVLAAFVESDYETPSSVPDIGVKHDDPQDVDQKEFNDQDKSPENPMNPNLQDSGASGEDEVRKDMGKPSQGQFSEESPGIQRMEMLMPLIEKYYHSDESGADDPMLKGLHEMLEAENPGYLNSADAEAAERFMQNKKKPEHVHAGTVHEAIMPPMQQGNLQAQQQALDPTALNPSMQPQAPSSQTPPGGMQQQGHCPNCGGVTQTDGSCPQCGVAAAPQAQPVPGGPSMAPHPQTFAHTDLLASLVDSANHQGPVTPEQIAAVQQYLIQEGRVDEVPNVPLDPGNPEYAKILSEVQGNPMNVPTVTPEEQTQPPAPQPAAPGGMPVPGMAPGESGGQPMQPMSSFLPDFTAADNIAPRCPQCGSATTGIIGDADHHAKCHSCQNVWKLNNVLSDENYGQTSIAKTALRDERQHGGQANEQANPIGVPAAEQEGQQDQGGDEDSSLTWKDSTGAPLKAGQQYQMINPSFSLPDLIRVERVKPDGLDVTLLGTYANDPSQHDPNMLTSSTPISKQDMELQQLSFEPVEQTADDRNNEPPPGSQAPGHAQVPPSGQTTDEQAASEPQMAAQSSVDPDCPRCGHREFTSAMITAEATEHSCFRCGHDWVTEEKDDYSHLGVAQREEWTNPSAEWLHEDGDAEDFSPRRTEMSRAAVQSRNISDIAEKDERLRAVHEHLQNERTARKERVAGKHFTPREQRELIDEDGMARNSDMLDLEGTHYRVRDDYESKTNPERVRDADLFLGI